MHNNIIKTDIVGKVNKIGRVTSLRLMSTEPNNDKLQLHIAVVNMAKHTVTDRRTDRRADGQTENPLWYMTSPTISAAPLYPTTFLMPEPVRPMMPNGIRIRSAVFYNALDRPTDRQTDRSSTGKFDDYSPLRL